MTKEDKELLLTDLCVRLRYGVNAEIVDMFGYTGKIHISVNTLPALDKSILLRCKPYLRPMSSMTNDEKKEYDSKRKHICDEYNRYCFDTTESVDWLNSHHFDHRDLIEKGLALPADKEMYKD